MSKDKQNQKMFLVSYPPDKDIILMHSDFPAKIYRFILENEGFERIEKEGKVFFKNGPELFLEVISSSPEDLLSTLKNEGYAVPSPSEILKHLEERLKKELENLMEEVENSILKKTGTFH